jgi:transcriptional regulator with XRE-family HTH domain
MRQGRVRSAPSAGALGSALAHLRRERGLSQAELARRLGMSAPNLSRIEHGADLRVSTLLDLARALKLEPVLVPKDRLAMVRALLDDRAGGDEADGRPERGRFA